MRQALGYIGKERIGKPLTILVCVKGRGTGEQPELQTAACDDQQAETTAHVLS